MKRFMLWSCLAAAVVVVSPRVFARCLIDEDMGGDSNRLIWCDGFDSYCVAVADPWLGYPPFPAVCPNVAATVDDHAEFLANWPKVVPPSGPAGGNQDLSTAREQAGVYSLLFHGGQVATRHAFDLTEAIQQKNAAHNAINGSDAAPLILKFTAHHGDFGAAANSPYYLEMYMSGDRAPTNYVTVECPTGAFPNCPAEYGPFPIVCQQDPAHYNPIDCPPADPNDYHASVAMGWLAPMDREPCDSQTGCKPTLDHPVVYNGRYWLEPRSNQWPPSVGDFNMGSSLDGRHWMKLQIKTSQMIFTYSNDYLCPASFPCWCTIPRDYTGPFNTIATGPGAGCELDVNDLDGDTITNECAPGAEYKMFDYASLSVNSWHDSFADTMVVYDGETTSVIGACCLADASCIETTQQDCEGNYEHATFKGLDTLCANVQCCPYPFADGDLDGDVDQADFGLWQACYDGGTGLIAGCECYDRVAPAGSVDGDDFTEFANCFTGANVPFDPNVFTNCVPN